MLPVLPLTSQAQLSSKRDVTVARCQMALVLTFMSVF